LIDTGEGRRRFTGEDLNPSGVETRAERDALAAFGVALFVGGGWEPPH
jgi:hypothetical protein